MTSNNIFGYNVFSAWAAGRDDKKSTFLFGENIHQFADSGHYVGFIKHSTPEHALFIEEFYKAFEDTGMFKPATMLEVIKSGFVGITINMFQSQHIYWYTDQYQTKPELRFIPQNFVIMEIDIRDEVEANAREPESV